MKFPAELHYTAEHLWVRPEADGEWLAGITEYAQDLLGDIVFVDPPKVGSTLNNGQPCGIVESVKTGSDLHAPADGTVTAINDAVLSSPEAINDKPYVSWIFKFRPADTGDIAHYLSAEAYTKLVDN